MERRRMLLSSKKLAHFGCVVLWMMCVCAIYLIYIDVSQTVPNYSATGRPKDRVNFELYGLNLRRKQSKVRYEPATTLARQDKTMPTHKEVIYGDEDSWLEIVEEDGDGDIEDDTAGDGDDLDEDDYDNEEDEKFYQDYPDEDEQENEKVTKLFPREIFHSSELSTETLGDQLTDPDDKDVNLVEEVAFDGIGIEHKTQDVQNPEAGSRYQNVIEQPNQHPPSKLTPMSPNTEAQTQHRETVRISRNKDNHATTLKRYRFTHNPGRKPVRWKSDLAPAFPPPYDNHPPEDSAKDRFLVYVCDPQGLCGGWGDRQRGLTSAYFLARLTNRQFRIIMSTPCDLSNFYLPNRVQWRVVGNELVSDSNVTINAFLNKNLKVNIMQVDFNQRFPQKVVYLKTNQDYYERLSKNPEYPQFLKQWGSLYDRPVRFRWAWTDLMKPSPMLLSHLEHIVGTDLLVRKGVKPASSDSHRYTNDSHYVGDSTFICAHVRMGKNPTIPMDEDFNSVTMEDLPKLLNFMSSQDSKGDAKFFVATDNEEVRSRAKTFFGEKLVSFGGKILHIDRQRSSRSACVGFEVALIDQQMLSLCDILVVSRSGFSILASYINNSTQPFYIMENGEIRKLKDETHWLD